MREKCHEMQLAGKVQLGRVGNIIAIFITALTLLQLMTACGNSKIKVSTADANPASQGNLSDGALSILAEIAFASIDGQDRRVDTVADIGNQLESSGPVYVALRSNGKCLAEAWSDENTWRMGYTTALQEAVKSLDPSKRDSVDAVESCLVYNYSAPKWRPISELPMNAERGVVGLALARGNKVYRYPPTKMIARNLGFRACCEDAGFTDDELATNYLTFSTFRSHQVFIRLADRTAHELFRGNRIVAFESVNQNGVNELAEGMASWILNNSDEEGRVTYKYWPSRGESSTADNTIRQFLTTIALQCWARYKNDPALKRKSELNLDSNLKHYYRCDGEFGLIYDGEQIKLGAVALAALAIVSSDVRPKYAAEENALLATVNSLYQRDTGAFQSFFNQPTVTRNQNFYPGEALLLWATLYSESRNEDLLSKIMKSFAYYRDWHRKSRNPAFVPWHTQAYCRVWEVTHDPALRDFALEMNDWLVPTQQWDDAPFPDMRGRFYSPSIDGYGPPHASSTGVYLEGLLAAYKLASSSSDLPRAGKYRLALKRGFRSIMQHQFADDIDLFYISKKDNARGGIRTTEYDNEIRMDNVAHNLIAAVGALEDGIFLESSK